MSPETRDKIRCPACGMAAYVNKSGKMSAHRYYYPKLERVGKCAGVGVRP